VLGIIHPEEQQAAGNLTKHFLFESMAGLITPSVCVCVCVCVCERWEQHIDACRRPFL